MLALPEAVILPLKMDAYGAIRVSDTRVTLDTLIAFYQQGETAEALHEGFPTVPLSDIHAVISYYLANRDEVDTYLAARREAAEALRNTWASEKPSPTKAELLQRFNQREAPDEAQ
jgi:uncharacterized protein (DUF433 family)